MDKTERWFNAFKAEADAFDIYGAGCTASDNANNSVNEKEKQGWLDIANHCKAIMEHIDAIKELGRF